MSAGTQKYQHRNPHFRATSLHNSLNYSTRLPMLAQVPLLPRSSLKGPLATPKIFVNWTRKLRTLELTPFRSNKPSIVQSQLGICSLAMEVTSLKSLAPKGENGNKGAGIIFTVCKGTRSRNHSFSALCQVFLASVSRCCSR